MSLAELYSGCQARDRQLSQFFEKIMFEWSLLEKEANVIFLNVIVETKI